MTFSIDDVIFKRRATTQATPAFDAREKEDALKRLLLLDDRQLQDAGFQRMFIEDGLTALRTAPDRFEGLDAIRARSLKALSPQPARRGR